MTVARTCTVRNVVEIPGPGRPIARQLISIRLNVASFTNNGAVEKLSSARPQTDANGLWSELLEINDDIDPAGTWYTVRERPGGPLWAFQLRAEHAGTVQNLHDVLLRNPVNPDPLVIFYDFGNIDGGDADAIYAGIPGIDGGTV